MKVSGDGVDIEVEADAPGGEPVVLIMGLGAQLIMWPDGFCDELRARGFRVIRLDNRDTGLSTHLKHAPVPNPRKVFLRALLGLPIAAPYQLHHMAADVIRVLDALDVPKAHIVGASMGGMIAQTLAIAHPDRTLSLTSIMSTSGARRHSLGIKPEALRALLKPIGRTREDAVRRMVDMFRIIGSKTHVRDEALLIDLATRSYDRGTNPAGFARQIAAICASGSREEALRNLRCPTLVIHGAQDPLIPVAAGRAVAKLVPNARLLELGDMGHDLPRPLWPTVASAIRSIATPHA